MAKYQCVCVICNLQFTASRATTKTCSRTCYGKNQSGSNNSNFGNKWTDEQRQAGSILKKEQFKNDPDYAYKCGETNRGVKFSQERIQAMHSNRDRASYVHLHSDATKKIIGAKSKSKFTPDFKKKHRQTMEEKGQWVKLEDKDPYDTYYKEANWIGSMIELFDDESKQLLTKHGLFSRKNPKGWVRDHVVPRMAGYEFSLPPQILRHPANLKFISHGDNVAKGFTDRKLTENEKSATIELLKNRILEFTSNWQEQEWCLAYIRNIK